MDMTDEELMALLAELGTTDQQLGNLDEQIALAQQLRYQQPESATVQAGNAVVPNYAGAINRAIGGFMGRKQEKDLSSQRETLLGQQTDARKAYGQALLGQPRPKRTLEEELLAMRMPQARF
jgi:hypothetical protein